MSVGARWIKRVLDAAVVPALFRAGPLLRVARYVGSQLSEEGYLEHRKRFIENGSRSRFGRDVRESIVRRYEAIDRAVVSESLPSEGLAMAEALLTIEAAGEIVECGCYNGASTAKLSIVAKQTGRRLVTFDSFEGLPSVGEPERKDLNLRKGSEWTTEWLPGRYAASYDSVRANVEKYGESDVCTLVKGWFDATVNDRNLPPRLALGFVDADIPSSVRTCFEQIWPRLSPGGVYFQHDVGFLGVIDVVHDPALWADRFRESPPVLYGAGFGLGDAAPYLGFMVKGRNNPDYVKSLTVFK